MKISAAPHRWTLTPRRAIAVQKKLAAQISFVAPQRTIRLVAGVDAAFSDDGRRCIAAVVLWDAARGEVVEQRIAQRPLRFPYVPGLLSFREAPAVIAALRRLRASPDALMVDGHGFAHPRRFGIACHVGLLAGVPTVGCAKSVLVGEHGVPGRARGAATALVHRGERVGTVLRTQDGVRPVFVSVGHHVDLRAAVRLVLRCARCYRLPEPTRLADQLVGRAKREGSFAHPNGIRRRVR